MLTGQRPSVLLYDWDNTLVDGWTGITVALNAVFSDFGHPLWTVDDTRNRVRVSLRDSFPVMFGDRWQHARDIFYEALTKQHLDHVTPMPGVPDVLQAGAAWPQGVVSNKAGAFLRREVIHLGWSRFFGPVIGAGDASSGFSDASRSRNPVASVADRSCAPLDNAFAGCTLHLPSLPIVAEPINVAPS